jgi:hypothetical protein
MSHVSRFARHALALAVIGLGLAGLAVSVPARAGHDVEKDDPAVVAERLHRMGFVEWRYLKWDHGYWKIDDARRENGHVYDLKLEAVTFDLVRLEREER